MTVKFSIDLHGRYPVDEYIRIAKLAEDHGFDEVHVVDDLGFKPAWPLLALIARMRGLEEYSGLLRSIPESHSRPKPDDAR